MRISRRQPQQPELPAAPPDPAALRAVHQTQTEAAAQQWRDWLERRVLPAVNAALSATTYTSYRVGHAVTVSGCNGRAGVWEAGVYSGWAPLVYGALAGSMYSGYRVRCYVTWYTGDAARHATENHEQEISLEGGDGALRAFMRKYYDGKSVNIDIFV